MLTCTTNQYFLFGKEYLAESGTEVDCFLSCIVQTALVLRYPTAAMGWGILRTTSVTQNPHRMLKVTVFLDSFFYLSIPSSKLLQQTAIKISDS